MKDLTQFSCNLTYIYIYIYISEYKELKQIKNMKKGSIVSSILWPGVIDETITTIFAYKIRIDQNSSLNEFIGDFNIYL